VNCNKCTFLSLFFCCDYWCRKRVTFFHPIKRIYIDKRTIESINIKRFVFLIMFPLQVIDNLYKKRKRKERDIEYFFYLNEPWNYFVNLFLSVVFYATIMCDYYLLYKERMMYQLTRLLITKRTYFILLFHTSNVYSYCTDSQNLQSFIIY